MMKFLDYEKVIRGSYPMLIESYVKQYGEEYRERITNVLERLKYCIFVTPSNIKEYVERKSSEDYMKAILDSYLQLGIDISELEIDEEGLVFHDNKVGELTMALFPDLTSLENFKKRGIFAFRDEYDDLDVDDPMTIERMVLLEKLNKKSKDISYQDYYNSYKYKADCLFCKQLLKVIEINLRNRVEEYDDLLSYADDIDKSVLEIGRELELDFLISIKEYLSKHDQLLLESCNFKLDDLDSYGLYFDLDLVCDDYCFSDGPIDYFLDTYTEDLLDSEVSQTEKDMIVKMRFKYLEKMGFDISKLKSEELFCDWYEISELVPFLPKKDDLKIINDKKNKYYINFEYECAKLCVINGYDLRIDDVEIETILDEDGHSCSVYLHDEVIDTDNFACVICLNPFMDTYNLFDIAIDHELRHAVEMRMKGNEKQIILKTGCDIAYFDGEFENGRSSFTDLNERITQRLSVDATVDRWERGQFIFSDKYALLTAYPLSVYDLDLDNLDIIYEPFKDRIVKAQISPDFNKMYEVIPRRDLKKINSLITQHDTASVRKLKAIKRRLLTRELDRKASNVKVKKIGMKDE